MGSEKAKQIIETHCRSVCRSVVGNDACIVDDPKALYLSIDTAIVGAWNDAVMVLKKFHDEHVCGVIGCRAGLKELEAVAAAIDSQEEK